MLDYGPNRTHCKNLSPMNDLSVNPLLDLDEQGRSNAASAGRAGAASGLPHFSAIRAEHVEPAVDATLAANRAAIERLLVEVGEPTWASFVQPIEDMNEAEKKRFKDIEQELSTLQSKFEENVLDATNAWELFITDEQELAGLPESARAAARQAAERDGKSGWKLTLHMPSFLPVMMYADNRELRRPVYEASATRASQLGPHTGRWDNGPIMQQVLALHD